MNGAGSALLFAFTSIAHPRILWLMLWPVLLALAAWGAAVLIFWGQLVVWLGSTLKGWVQTATFFFNWDSTDVTLFALDWKDFKALIDQSEPTAREFMSIVEQRLKTIPA